MRHEFRLADIGEGLEEAEIINWLVAVGDHVRRDQPLIEVMTDKSNAELPAPAAGVITELGGAVGDLITVGELIAVIDEADQPADGQPEPSSPTEPSQLAAAQPTAADGHDATPESSPATMQAARIKASPSTRRIAAERGVDLANVSGSGPGGRILLADLDGPAVAGSSLASAPVSAVVSPPVGLVPAVQAVGAAQAVQVQPAIVLPVQSQQSANVSVSAAPTGVVPLRGVRRAVAKNMTQSWSEIPHIHAFAHIDATALMDLRSRLRETGRAEYQNLTPLTFFVAAVAKALAAHPQANASLNMADETISYHPHVNVGVAVASPQGLVVPVLQGADRLDFATLSLTLAELVRGAREGVLPREHFRGGTVTITNFGSLGGEQAAPLIRPPESMILGFGSIAKRPFVVDDQVVARSTIHTVAGADHRLLDGDTTTAVLGLINDLLSDPLQLVL